MADSWIKEFRMADKDRYLDVIMAGAPTLNILDNFIETLTSLRNEWAEEQKEVTPMPAENQHFAGTK